MIVSMIAAMAQHRVIGLNGDMPWHLPADLAHFKKTTMGCPVIMGRRTYDSIGKPLPGRQNVVLSRDTTLVIEGCEVAVSLDDAFKAISTNTHEVFIIGGQQLYEQALPLANRLYLTHIQANIEGDTQFPDYSSYTWKQLTYSEHTADERNRWSYSFEVLEKVSD